MLLTPSVVALALVSATVAGSPEPSAARQVELTYLVRQDCGSCHGLTLRGGLGSPLLPERLRDRQPADLAHVILAGIPGTPMPPWAPLLSESEALWIARALQRGLSDAR